jgi:hypothetical protein
LQLHLQYVGEPGIAVPHNNLTFHRRFVITFDAEGRATGPHLLEEMQVLARKMTRDQSDAVRVSFGRD